MIWIDGDGGITPCLPAVWLAPTMAAPANLDERSQLRRETARRILARQLGRDAVAIEHLASGQPVLAGADGLHLSLATRAGLVAVALATMPIGVDVEQVQPDIAIPWTALHPQERRKLEAQPDAARARSFARLWAAKEAYVKALGTGFLRPPESFAVSLHPDAGFTVCDPERTREPQGHTRFIENSGQVTLAAAVIVLD